MKPVITFNYQRQALFNGVPVAGATEWHCEPDFQIVWFLELLPHQVEKKFGLVAWWDGQGRCLAAQKRLDWREYVKLLLNKVDNSYDASPKKILEVHSQIHPLLDEYPPNGPDERCLRRLILGATTADYNVTAQPSPFGKTQPGGEYLLIILFPGGTSKMIKVNPQTVRPPDQLINGYGDTSVHGSFRDGKPGMSSWNTEFKVWHYDKYHTYRNENLDTGVLVQEVFGG